jgi:hypothetical protein
MAYKGPNIGGAPQNNKYLCLHVQLLVLETVQQTSHIRTEVPVTSFEHIPRTF